jgi:hypothetical protein
MEGITWDGIGGGDGFGDEEDPGIRNPGGFRPTETIQGNPLQILDPYLLHVTQGSQDVLGDEPHLL